MKKHVTHPLQPNPHTKQPIYTQSCPQILSRRIGTQASINMSIWRYVCSRFRKGPKENIYLNTFIPVKLCFHGSSNIGMEVKSWSKGSISQRSRDKRTTSLSTSILSYSTQNEVVKYGLEFEHLNVCKLPSVQWICKFIAGQSQDVESSVRGKGEKSYKLVHKNLYCNGWKNLV